MKKESSKKTTKETKKSNFREFKYSGKTFEYDGRIYASRDGYGNVSRYWGMSLTLNNTITINGVKLVETKNDNIFLSWPSYESNGDWKDYIFVDQELRDEIDNLLRVLMKTVGIDEGSAEEVASDSDTNLPF